MDFSKQMETLIDDIKKNGWGSNDNPVRKSELTLYIVSQYVEHVSFINETHGKRLLVKPDEKIAQVWSRADLGYPIKIPKTHQPGEEWALGIVAVMDWDKIDAIEIYQFTYADATRLADDKGEVSLATLKKSNDAEQIYPK